MSLRMQKGDRMDRLDRLLLEYYIKKSGRNVEAYCKDVGISRSAYFRKTHGESEFTQGEIQSSIDCGYVPRESVMQVFFPGKVS